MSNRLERTFQKAIGLMQQRQFGEARPLVADLARKAPKHPLVWNLLGVIASDEKDYTKAIEYFAKAAKLAPNDADFHNNLGEAYRKAACYQESLPCFEAALKLQPAHAAAHNNIGATLNALHREVEAADHLAKAVRLRPDNFEAYTNLGIALMNQRKPHDAVPCFEHAYRLNREDPVLLFHLGTAMEYDNRFEEAYAFYEQVIETVTDDPDRVVDMVVKQVSNLDRSGRRDEAWALLEPLLDSQPEHPGVACQFGRLAKRHMRGEEASERLSKVAELPEFDADTRKMILFELGNVNDSLGRYDAAFVAYHRANELDDQVYDHAADVRQQEEIERIYAPGWQANLAQASNRSEVPVFIVGMPRSGTSLVEQIIDCHPQAYGAGELGRLVGASRALAEASPGRGTYPKCMESVDEALLDIQAKEFLGFLAETSGGAARVTDKMPHNHRHLGLIEQLFPNARVLHCKRDPVDTCLSCYFQNFYHTGHAYSADLADLGAHYRLYERSMAHWKTVSKLPIMDVSYETLVDDQEQVSRSMIDFLGLEWDDACLRFHESSRRTLTASYDQVRQPIYRRSVSRHERYQVHLRPLIEALGRTDAADAA